MLLPFDCVRPNIVPRIKGDNILLQKIKKAFPQTA